MSKNRDSAKNKTNLTVDQVGEFGLIARLTNGLSAASEQIIRGVGDDTAVLKVDSERLLLATCDIQIEGIHFTSDAFSSEAIGYRAAAVNVSDIAAMGGLPKFALVSLVAPPRTEVELLDGIYIGLRRCFDEWGAIIVGGNTAELPERLAIDVTLLGEVDGGQMLLRSGAEPGNLLCVTGELGASAGGLQLIRDPSIAIDEDLRKDALRAHREPTPRVREGIYLARSEQATACIDISDGVLGDANHLAVESNVCVVVDCDRLPVAPAAVHVADAMNADVHSLSLAGGEDFELLFTVRSDAVEETLSGLQKATGTRATVIGTIREGSARVLVERSGRPFDVQALGFDHFTR